MKIFNEYSPINPPPLDDTHTLQKYAVSGTTPSDTGVFWVDDSVQTAEGGNSIKFYASPNEPSQSENAQFWIDTSDDTPSENIAEGITYTSGHAIEWQTGVSYTSTLTHTPFIDLGDAVEIIYPRLQSISTQTSARFGMAFYDSSYHYISGQKSLTKYQEMGYETTRLSVPANAKYARFSWSNVLSDFWLYALGEDSGCDVEVSQTPPSDTSVLWIDVSEDDNSVINYTLPGRRTVNVYGLSTNNEYETHPYYLVPGTTMRVQVPELGTTRWSADGRSYISPENVEAVVTDVNCIKLKGFARRSTVSSYLASIFFNAGGQFSEYYDILSEEWSEANLYQYFADENHDMDFSPERYGEANYPFEIMFECGVDFSLNSDGTIDIPGTTEDLFAIYERKTFTYTFYCPDNTLYDTIEVIFGDSPYDPAAEAGAPPLPADVDIRYKLVSDSSGADVVWSAVADSTSTTGDFVNVTHKAVTTSANRWRESSMPNSQHISLVNYTAGTPNQATSFVMRYDVHIPVIWVIDGVPEGLANSYGANNGVSPITGYTLQNYSSYAIRQYINSDSRTQSAPNITDSNGDRKLDCSIGWFYNAACSNRMRGGSSYDLNGATTPVFYYTKSKNIYRLAITRYFENFPPEGLEVIISSLFITSVPTYSCTENGQSVTLSYLSPTIVIDDNGYTWHVDAVDGAVLDFHRAIAKRESATSIYFVDSWYLDVVDAAGSVTVTRDHELWGSWFPWPFDKPKIRVPKNHIISQTYTYNGTQYIESATIAATLNQSTITQNDYIVSDVTVGGLSYYEIVASGFTYDNVAPQQSYASALSNTFYQFDLSQLIQQIAINKVAASGAPSSFGNKTTILPALSPSTITAYTTDPRSPSLVIPTVDIPVNYDYTLLNSQGTTIGSITSYVGTTLYLSSNPTVIFNAGQTLLRHSDNAVVGVGEVAPPHDEIYTLL